MKIKQLFWNRNKSLKTFPISHILLLIITILWILEIDWYFWKIAWEINEKLLISLLFCLLLSCLGPLYYIHSTTNNKNKTNWILQSTAILLWWIYFAVLLNIDNIFNATYSENLIFFGIILLAWLSIPLLIAVLHKNEEDKIWFSRHSLFGALICWWIAGSIIRWWIAWALWSIEALFDINIDSDRYLYIWIISEILIAWSLTFNYYLTSVEDINSSKSEFKIEPSRLRKIFGSYIYLPLTIIYLAIFFAYLIKIIITWIWPKWIIVRLWIGYFTLWMICIYLNIPNKTKTYKTINKIIYISFILIAFMMIWAITKRINQYWFTINRCFICYMIILIIIYSILSLIFTKKRLSIFITALSILSFISLYWRPFNTSNISFNSQVNRLTNIIKNENLSLPLWDWSLKNTDEESATVAIWAIEELAQHYNKNKIINKIISYEYEWTYRYSERSKIREFLWINDDLWEHKYFNYRASSETYINWIDISWYSKFYQFEADSDNILNDKLKLNINNEEYIIDYSEYKDELIKKADENDNKEPAIIIEKDNYKIWITSYFWEINWTINQAIFNWIYWYILIK